MQALVVCAVVLLAAVSVQAVGKDVVVLTPDNFKSQVLNSEDVWLVEFYAPWCGHCKNLEPEWTKAATALKGIVKLGAVDANEHQSMGGQYGVKGFPTIKVFGLDKSKPTDYQGGRTAKDIVAGALEAAKTVANQRLSGKTGSGSSGSSGSNKKSDSGSSGSSDSKDVIELTDDNFSKLVTDSSDFWMVEFFAPWCGHCKSLAPQWAKAASELKGVAKLGAVDATVHQALASKFGIKGYPTIIVFNNGQQEPYEGGRTSSDIVSFAKDKASESQPPKPVVELTSQESFASDCTDHQVCIIAFLPDLLDSGAAGRNKYIAILEALSATFRKRPFGWTWAAAGHQENLEKSVGVGGFGYPALVAVNGRKKRFALSATAFTEKSIKEFVNEVVAAKQATVPWTVPTLTQAQPWDGKDAQVETVEEFDLSELDDVDLGSKDEL